MVALLHQEYSPKGRDPAGSAGTLAFFAVDESGENPRRVSSRFQRQSGRKQESRSSSRRYRGRQSRALLFYAVGLHLLALIAVRFLLCSEKTVPSVPRAGSAAGKPLSSGGTRAASSFSVRRLGEGNGGDFVPLLEMQQSPPPYDPAAQAGPGFLNPVFSEPPPPYSTELQPPPPTQLRTLPLLRRTKTLVVCKKRIWEFQVITTMTTSEWLCSAWLNYLLP